MDALFTRNANIKRTLKPVPHGHMSALHFGDVNTPIKMVFLHAAGFHALAYRSLLENLGVHILALDLRGHGHTQLPTHLDDVASFNRYAKDVISYLDAHVPGKIILCGHSLGASSAILAARMAPDKISKVLAFDPVILPLFVRFIMKTKGGRNRIKNKIPMARNAGRRRDVFPSLQAAYQRFHGRGSFKNFTDVALWDYVSGGFAPQDKADGDGVRLLCRPKWEQHTYAAQGHNLRSAIRQLPQQSRLLVTNFVEPVSWIPKMQEKCPHISIEHHPKLDHFFPLLNPEVSLSALKAILEV